MEGLQRSAVSFRRQGSSGMVWDDKFLTAEINKVAKEREEQAAAREIQEKLDSAYNNKQERSPNSEVNNNNNNNNSIKPVLTPSTIERSRSNGGTRGYRTGKVSPAIEPPSPRVSACGFCAAFGKPPKNHRKKAGKVSKVPRSR